MATSTPPKGNSANRDRPAKRPTTQQSHARAAKARLEQERKRRQRILFAGVAGAIVLAVVVVLIAVKLTQSSNKTAVSTATNYVPDPAPGNVVTTLAGIPATSLSSSFGQYGKNLSSAPHAVNGVAPPGQGTGGPPEFLYIGANYCPYCAAERWAMVTALSKFGTFTNLGQTTSSASDVDPNTPTFTFYQSTYTSQYIKFVPVETTTNQPSGSGYQTLQTPTAAQQQVWSENDPQGSIPFIYIAGKFLQTGSPYDPGLLAGKTMNEIAQAATDPTTKIGQAIQAAAGSLVSDICSVTKDQPASVCSAFSGSSSGG
jgi:hypothetical protein